MPFLFQRHPMGSRSLRQHSTFWSSWPLIDRGLLPSHVLSRQRHVALRPARSTRLDTRADVEGNARSTTYVGSSQRNPGFRRRSACNRGTAQTTASIVPARLSASLCFPRRDHGGRPHHHSHRGAPHRDFPFHGPCQCPRRDHCATCLLRHLQHPSPCLALAWHRERPADPPPRSCAVAAGPRLGLYAVEA